MEFRDRAEAGRIVAQALAHLRGDEVVVLGLAAGGVPVAAEVARALHAPLDVLVVRKVGVPWQPELAMGAIGEDGVSLVVPGALQLAGVEPDELAEAQEHARSELDRTVAGVHDARCPVALSGRTVILVDDGMATGVTARVACQIARRRGAARVIVAVPVGSGQALASLEAVADEVVCPVRPGWFHTVGQWYGDFGPVSDTDVLALLRGVPPVRAAEPPGAGVDREVTVRAGGVELAARLTVPPRARGLVIFAHGSGSGRHSPRNRYLARLLNGAGLGTLLLDLLTVSEEAQARHVFDIDLLGSRLADAATRSTSLPAAAGLPVGVFGASTGAAAALWAAARSDSAIVAVACRGGRPDLAGSRLGLVEAPTLFIVGGQNQVVAELNRVAQTRMHCATRLAIVPGATHLFVEPGALTVMAGLARDWFTTYLPARTTIELHQQAHAGT